MTVALLYFSYWVAVTLYEFQGVFPASSGFFRELVLWFPITISSNICWWSEVSVAHRGRFQGLQVSFSDVCPAKTHLKSIGVRDPSNFFGRANCRLTIYQGNHDEEISIPNFSSAKQWQKNQSPRLLSFLWHLGKEPSVLNGSTKSQFKQFLKVLHLNAYLSCSMSSIDSLLDLVKSKTTKRNTYFFLLFFRAKSPKVSVPLLTSVVWPISMRWSLFVSLISIASAIRCGCLASLFRIIKYQT